MSWKNLKIIALIVLLLLNVVLGYLVINTFVLNENYDDITIKKSIQLLKDSDIVLDEKTFPSKRQDMFVYQSAYTESDYLEALNAFTGKKVFYEGDHFVASSANGNYTISKHNTFNYKTSVTVMDAQHKTQINDWASVTKYTKLAKDFLRFKELLAAEVNKNSTNKTTLSTNELSRCGDGFYELILDEYLGNYKTGNQVILYFSEEIVIQASGTILFLMPSTDFETNNVDILNILTSEKDYFDSVPHERLTIQSIEFGYELCTDVYDNGFLLPICRISYINAIDHTYDLVTGKMVKSNG